MNKGQVTISKELLLTAGYKQYEKSKLDHDSITECFQKKIRGDYFINVNHWFHSNHALMDSWQFKVQFHTLKGGAVNVELVQWFNNSGTYSGKTIQDAEDFFEKIWQTGMFQSYD